MSQVVIVMTAWNPNPAWLGEARASVVAQLQPGDWLELVDDGSEEPIPGAIIRIPHSGIGPASNVAIADTTRPLIARLDADDRLLPGSLAVLRQHLDDHPNVDVVSGGMIYIRPDGSRFSEVSYPPFVASPRHNNSVAHSGSMFRRSLWERVGGYPAMRFADWHFWEAAQTAGALFTVLDQPVIERRIHPGSFSFSNSKHLQRAWETAQK